MFNHNNNYTTVPICSAVQLTVNCVSTLKEVDDGIITTIRERRYRNLRLLWIPHAFFCDNISLIAFNSRKRNITRDGVCAWKKCATNSHKRKGMPRPRRWRQKKHSRLCLLFHSNNDPFSFLSHSPHCSSCVSTSKRTNERPNFSCPAGLDKRQRPPPPPRRISSLPAKVSQNDFDTTTKQPKQQPGCN